MVVARSAWRGIGFAGAAGLGLAALAGAGMSQPSGTTDSGPGYVCLAQPSDKRELAFAVSGRIGETLVKPGDRVSVGQTLIRLDDRYQRQTVELAKRQADDENDARAAAATLAFREEDLRRTERSYQASGANESELLQARLERDLAQIKLNSTAEGREQARIAWEREKARLDHMRVDSPIDGIVIELRKRAGESVDELTPALTLVTIDPLWVEANVPMRDALRIQPGQEAEVVWDDIDTVTPMRGRVIFKSPVGNAGARELLVRVEVPNPDSLPSGLHGRIRFIPAQAAAAVGSGGGAD